MDALYALSAPHLVIAWMSAILLGAGLSAAAAALRSAGRMRSQAYRR